MKLKHILCLMLIFLISAQITQAGWTAKTSGTTNALHSVYFIGDVGYTVGSSTSIRKSENTGETWTAVTTNTVPQVNSDYKSVWFNDVNTGWVSGTQGRLVKTTDGGSNWTRQAPDPFNNDLYSIEFNGTYGLCVGANATVSYSENTGSTWTPYNGPSLGGDIFDVYMESPSIAYACGENGLIVKTTDGGYNWDVLQVGSATFDLNSIYFATDDIAFAVGTNGTVQKTTDGGSNWSTIDIGTSEDLNAVFFPSAERGYIVGSGGVILVTSDQGSNWYPQYSGITTDLFDIFFTSNNTGYAVGASGVILKTTDGGGIFSADINVTNPMQEEVLISGTTEKIEWETNANISNVKLYYSLDGGTTWIYIDSETASVGEYNWTIPSNISSETCRIKVADSQLESFYGTSDEFTIITRDIEIIKPQAGVTWKVGETRSIEWTTNYNTTLKLQYSTNGGTDWTDITTTPSTNGFYSWTVPTLQQPSTNCKIKIIDNSISTIYAISGAFTITNLSITLNSPIGNEIWYPETAHDIIWEISDNIDLEKIEFSKDGGTTWSLVDEDIAQDDISSPYSWTIPNEPSGQCLIKVSDKDNTEVYDTSDDYFSIPGVKLDDNQSINNGSTLLTGSEVEITWSSHMVETVDLLFSSDDGDTWANIAEGIDAEHKSFTWTVPYSPSVDCKIKIIDPNNTIFYDQTEPADIFSISGLVLTSPVGGEVWVAGTEEQITWQSVDVTNVKLEYTINDGASWTTIEATTLASTGSYDWDIPKTGGYECRIRISDVDAPQISDMSEEFFTLSGNGIYITSPAEGDEWLIGTSYDIQWVVANTDSVKIEYSTDNAATWTKIDSINAKARQISWTPPNTIDPSTECYIRISDAYNADLYSLSGLFKIRNATDNSYRPPQSWQFSNLTGGNSTIIIPTSIFPVIGDDSLKLGDAVGVFYNDGGQLKCAGYSEFDDDNMAITVWGDDPETEEKDGYSINETYIFKVWQSSQGNEYFAKATYSSGNDYYTDNGISILSALKTHTSFPISLPKGWSMISSYLSLTNSSIPFIMHDVEDNMKYMKDDGGYVYYPAEGINNLQVWEQESGYQVYMNEPDVLILRGVPVEPSDYPISIDKNKWYIISYLRSAPMVIDSALRTMGTGGSRDTFYIVKDDMGRIFYPHPYYIRQLDSMKIGEGYKIFCNYNETITYPDNDASGTKIKRNDYNPVLLSENKRRYNPTYSATGNTGTIIIESHNLEYGDEVGVWSSSGLLIGSGRMDEKYCVVNIWGDNQFTSIVDGALPGEELNFSILKHGETHQRKLFLHNTTNLLESGADVADINYYSDMMLKSDAEIESLRAVEETHEINYIKLSPNPANDFVHVAFSLETAANVRIDVINHLGEEVISVETDFYNTGHYNELIELSQLAAGPYYIKISAGGNTQIEKLHIIR